MVLLQRGLESLRLLQGHLNFGSKSRLYLLALEGGQVAVRYRWLPVSIIVGNIDIYMWWSCFLRTL